MIINPKEGKEKGADTQRKNKQKTNRKMVDFNPKTSLLWLPFTREGNQGTEKEKSLSGVTEPGRSTASL